MRRAGSAAARLTIGEARLFTRRRGLVKAVLFDAYGTLFHYERARLRRVFDRIVRGQALEIDAGTLFGCWDDRESEFRKRRVRRDGKGEWRQEQPFRSYRDVWAECFREAFRGTGVASGDPDAATEALVSDLIGREVFSETAAALDALRERVTVGVVSNADERFLYGTLAYNGLEFGVVVFSERERVYKPHPLLFERALRRIGAEPHEVIYVGDSPVEDVEGTNGAGMLSVWVNRDGADWPLGDEVRPTHEVPDLLGLVNIVDSRSGAVI